MRNFVLGTSLITDLTITINNGSYLLSVLLVNTNHRVLPSFPKAMWASSSAARNSSTSRTLEKISQMNY